MEVKSCPLCNDATKSFKMIEKDGYLILSCRNCGDYAASEEVIEDNVLSDHPKRHILSGLAKNNKGPKHIFFHSGNIDSLINSSNIPLTPLEKLNTSFCICIEILNFQEWA